MFEEITERQSEVEKSRLLLNKRFLAIDRLTQIDVELARSSRERIAKSRHVLGQRHPISVFSCGSDGAVR